MITALQVAAVAVDARPVEVPRHIVPPVASGVLPKVVDNNEQLVSLSDEFLCLNLYQVDGWPGTRTATFARESVRSRLEYAQSLLPAGYTFAVFDAWRSMATVRALYAHYYGPGSDLAPGFLADPDDPDTLPPHNTGGAIDLTLAWQSSALALGTYFDDFSSLAGADALETTHAESSLDRNLRRLLSSVMTASGFVGLADEWWHFSYGDQEWAWQLRQSAACFGPVEPGDRASSW